MDTDFLLDVASQAVLQQVMNHRDAGIFQAYLNERVRCDVQAAFLGRPSADAPHQGCWPHEPLCRSTYAGRSPGEGSQQTEDSYWHCKAPTAARWVLPDDSRQIRRDREISGNRTACKVSESQACFEMC
jgi:hypothetical protein